MNMSLIPSVSGMVKVAANQFLVAHDGKRPNEPRLGVIDVEDKGLSYREIGIDKRPANEDLPNDVEGICAIPDRTGEYLLAESGFYPPQGEFGRIIKIGYTGGSALGAEYLGSFRPFPPPANKAETPDPEQIEGIASVAYDGTTALLLALRGSASNPKSGQPGQLIWGTLTDIDKTNPKFEENGRCRLSPDAIANRGAADLFVRPDRPDSTNTWEILSVATVDPYKDKNKGHLGPFLSAVYSAGILTINSGKIAFNRHSTCNVLWHIEGLKVEALAAPADRIENTELSIATDDEFYQGIWRPLPPSTGAQRPSEMLFIENVRTHTS